LNKDDDNDDDNDYDDYAASATSLCRRVHYGTETDILSDLIAAVDQRHVTFLGYLIYSAALD